MDSCCSRRLDRLDEKTDRLFDQTIKHFSTIHNKLNDNNDRLRELYNFSVDNQGDDKDRDDRIDDLNDQIHALRAELYDALEEDEEEDEADAISKHELFEFLNSEFDRAKVARDLNNITTEQMYCYWHSYEIAAIKFLGNTLLGYERSRYNRSF